MVPKKWILAWVLIMAVVFISGQAQIVVERLSHSFVVEPSGIYEGEIVVKNSSTVAAITVEVSQGDYLFFADGRSMYGDPGSVERSNAPWITLFLPPRFEIGPGERVPVRFRIQVPDDEEQLLVGTYWSMVFVAPVPAAADAPAEGVLIQEVTRYGIQIVTHIGDSGIRAIRNLGAALVRTQAGMVFQVDLENSGERSLSPHVYVEIYDLEGSFLDAVDSDRGRLGIYPGCSVRHQISLLGLDVGTYLVLLFIDNLDEYVWGTQVTLTVEE